MRNLEIHAMNASALAAVNMVLPLLGLGNFATVVKFGTPHIMRSHRNPATLCTLQGTTTSGRDFGADTSLSFSALASSSFQLVSARVTISVVHCSPSRGWFQEQSQAILEYAEETGYRLVNGPTPMQ
jgi:hypothetical protein